MTDHATRGGNVADFASGAVCVATDLILWEAYARISAESLQSLLASIEVISPAVGIPSGRLTGGQRIRRAKLAGFAQPPKLPAALTRHSRRILAKPRRHCRDLCHWHS